MAELARDYHNDLQHDCLSQRDDLTRAQAVFETLSSITAALLEAARENLSDTVLCIYMKLQ